jgi:hypothetical protein
LAAAIRYNNRETGTAFPGLKTLAEDIYRDLMQVPPRTAALIMGNVANLARQCGYLLSRRQAKPGGGRAVAHYTFTRPAPEERRAAIAIHRQWLDEENAKKAAKKKDGSHNSAGYVSSHNPPNYVRGGYHNSQPGADITRNREPHSLEDLEPKSEPTPGADAPRGVRGKEAFSGGAPDRGGDPPESAPTSEEGAHCKPSDGTPTKRKPAAPKATEEQFARFWAAYPIREGRAAALRNFLKLTRDEAELAIVGAAGYTAKIAAERARRGDEPRIKWAQGWLTERRFEDYAPANAAAPAGQSLAPYWWRDDPGFAANLEAADWQLLHDAHARNGAWPVDLMGPPPGAPGCLIPRDVIPKLKRGS